MINGRKWWTTGALDPRCRVLIVMGRTDQEAEPYRQQSMILVPVDAPGVEIVRALPVFGYQDQHGHGEVLFTDVRVPAENLLAGEGDGFRLAQERLGPGRVHHCMRAIGVAERALELMCRRALSREAFGQPLARQGVVREQIARSRVEIDQARLLVLQTAWLIDTVGAKAARAQVAAIKAVVPQMACDVVDRADPGPWRRGRLRRCAARRDVRRAAYAPDRRWARRGAPALGRAGRARQVRQWVKGSKRWA